MIMQLFRTEFRRHLKPFGIPTLFSLAFGILLAQSGSDDVYAVLALLLRLGLGLFVLGYMYADLKKSFFDRAERLPLLLPLRASVRLSVKTAALGGWAMLLWAAGQAEIFLNPLGLYAARIAHSPRPESGLLYLAASRASAVLCGIALLALGLALGLRAARVGWASALLRIGTLPAVCILLFAAMQLYVPEFRYWMIGTTSTDSYPQYAGPLAVNFGNLGPPRDIAETLSWTSVWFNLGTALVAMGIAMPVFDSPKFEARGERPHD